MQPSTTPHNAIKAGVDLDRVRGVVAPVLAAHGVGLVELVWTTDRTGWTLRLTIERIGAEGKPTGGRTLEDGTEVSRDVSSVLDVEDVIPHHYHLEVGTPGLDRPLKTEADFARFQGQLAKVKLAQPTPDGQRVL